MTENEMDYPQANTLALFAEMGTIERLVDCKHLNLVGLQAAWRWVHNANQLASASTPAVTRNLALCRERLTGKLLAALVRESGLPASHWESNNATTQNTPDDPSELEDD